MKTVEERLEWLEKQHERLYSTYELLSIHIPRMCDFWEKYFSVSGQYRYELKQELNGIRDFVRLVDKDMQLHYKVHSGKKNKAPDNKLDISI
uniref:Uncharacterized protein n=1 Tax=viral metagenome TaxID=1070528 RepID=A0A6M3LE39_9ZZZZ